MMKVMNERDILTVIGGAGDIVIVDGDRVYPLPPTDMLPFRWGFPRNPKPLPIPLPRPVPLPVVEI